MNIQTAAEYIGKTIDFSLYGYITSGRAFTGAKVIGLVDGQSASSTEDVQKLHTLIYPSLPVGTSNNAFSYYYLKVKLPSGTENVIGLPWIVEDSVSFRQQQTLTLVVSDANDLLRDRLRSFLLSNNVTKFNLELK